MQNEAGEVFWGPTIIGWNVSVLGCDVYFVNLLESQTYICIIYNTPSTNKRGFESIIQYIE